MVRHFRFPRQMKRKCSAGESLSPDEGSASVTVIGGTSIRQCSLGKRQHSARPRWRALHHRRSHAQIWRERLLHHRCFQQAPRWQIIDERR